MDLAMHRSVYVSIDLFTRLSIDLAIKPHCTYPLLCFKNRCLQELPLRYFPSSAYGCTIGVGDKTDAILSIYLSVYLSIYLIYLIYLSIYLSIYPQDQKRRNSVRLPSCLNITTSKTKQFCETSWFFELDNIRNEAILRDFLIFRSSRHQKQKDSARLPAKMESWVQSCQPRTNAFCDFSSPPV